MTKRWLGKYGSRRPTTQWMAINYSEGEFFEVPQQEPNRVCYEGGARRSMWSPQRRATFGRQNSSSKVLLVDNEIRLQSGPKKCEECQRLASIPHTTGSPSWHLLALALLSPRDGHTWPSPRSRGQVKFLFIAINYFAKWIEAEPLASITTNHVKKFVWKNVMCHFFGHHVQLVVDLKQNPAPSVPRC